MNSDLTSLQARIRTAELRRRAELHRLAVTARASKRGARPTRLSRQHLRNRAHAVRTIVARVSAALA
jgi:hypothetical protein